MNWYFWFVIGALIVCLISCVYHFIRIINKGNPKDYSKPSGNIKSSIKYAYTGAMSPTKKESAFLYLPTYSAGMLYHVGTFLSILLFIFILFNILPSGIYRIMVSGLLALTALSGLAILIKRILKKELRLLSNPDDYLSNFLVTAFQFITAYSIFFEVIHPVYYIITGALLLYLPLGKLKHTVFFFAARYHLGYFFGWRGVWPPK